MPVRKVPGGFQWGTTGKVYKTRGWAERQGRAIKASGYSKGGMVAKQYKAKGGGYKS